MSDHPGKKKKKFLNLPKYPGGSRAFREFLSATLRYPPQALEAGIEGAVLVEYDILDSGKVENMRVLKGIGHGCDEEAMRVISLLRYEKVKNRGVRVKVTTKTTLHFHLPPGLRITYTQESPANTPAASSTGGSGPVVYEYTVKF